MLEYGAPRVVHRSYKYENDTGPLRKFSLPYWTVLNFSVTEKESVGIPNGVEISPVRPIWLPDKTVQKSCVFLPCTKYIERIRTKTVLYGESYNVTRCIAIGGEWGGFLLHQVGGWISCNRNAIC